MQFFGVQIQALTSGILDINSVWYRRNAVGLPTAADQDALATHIIANLVPKFAPNVGANKLYQQVSVYSFDGSFNRVPYLPTIRALAVPGTHPVPIAPPVTAMVLSFRVEPQVVDPTTGKPVRKGYIPLSGIPEVHLEPGGTITSEYLLSTAMVALLNQLKASFAISTATELMEPIRVSNPPTGSTQRGYGLVKDCLARNYVSTRRSRMYGKGR